jgi:hypothetical protein
MCATRAEIQSLAVTPSDVVDAAVYNRENPGTAVLRVTPPFHGRMRARLHVVHGTANRVSEAVRLEPDMFLEESVLETYPSLDAEFDDVETTDTDQIRKRQQEALDQWCDRARDAIRDAIEIETADGPSRVDVTTLG